MAANTYDQLYQNYLGFHAVDSAFPYSAVVCSLPPDDPSTFIPGNSMSFETQTCFSDFWIYQQELGQYFNWIHRMNDTIFEEQPSLMKHEIYKINKRRPSVIQSVGQVLPLENVSQNIPLTNALSLHLQSLPLSVNHGISNHEGNATKTVMLKKKQSTGKTKSSFYEDVSNHRQGNPETCMRQLSSKISVSETPEEKKYRFYCRFCNKPYHWRSHWKAHERIHTGERPFKCEICGKAFTRSDGLQSHRHTHLRKEDSLISLFKNEEYVENDVLLQKQDTFNDDKSLQGLGGMQLTHEGKEYFNSRLDNNNVGLSKAKKDFHCHLCRKSFFSSNGLQHHQRLHSKDRS